MTKVNKIVKYLILADIAFWTGWGLVSPVFAIFIVEKIQGGTALVVGTATAVYWFFRSLLVLPSGRLLDKYAGEKDDYLFLVAGNFISTLVLFGYIFAIYPWHIYVLQAFYGIGIAMGLSGWRAIFTRNIDKGKEASEWALDDTSLSLGTAAAGIITGVLVTKMGYTITFGIAGFLGILSVLLLLCLRKEIEGVFNRRFHSNLKDIFRDKQ
ncbi:MAG TPA: MFS transporter [Candidatus Pacearchaeota archaeon]|nr:MFS transporter [Candidatus Pacearchaeota archaeon]HPR79828.1 MFS transporter [Candidatus Pacearchaeota archaeon]